MVFFIADKMKLRSGTDTQPIIGYKITKKIGYKIAKAGVTRVVVTLEIPEDAITNMKRKNIVNVKYAKHRTNKAKVLKIEDDTGKEYTSAISFSYGGKSLQYVLNDTIVINDYDMDLESVCSTGIHFFLTRRCAEFYDLSCMTNGLFQMWYDNGQKEVECMYVNGNRHGLYQCWYENGQKWKKCMYINNKEEGLFQCWYETGQKYMEYNSANGKRNGLYQMWHENGQKWEECNYEYGQKHGVFQSWHFNGQKSMECTYVNDRLHGLYQSWLLNGQKWTVSMYEKGKLVTDNSQKN